ncbi:MAG: hypothetical protein XD86_0938 [Mesotoga infera]|uniref:Uncharacterized protein n=1 Tax=Mesotoga infera TaxID=1236046 RepID=A0A101GYG1_9BACT|nr:MAG: hypothetical protein XD86_0938 [Mesotoga infera]
MACQASPGQFRLRRQASPGQFRLRRGQSRLRRAKTAAGIRNGEGCTLENEGSVGRAGLEYRVDESGLSERSIEERDAETSKDEFVGTFGGRGTVDAQRCLPAFSGSLFLSVQRFLGARSRTGTLRDDNLR